jgi:hypothetical protein
MDPRLRASPRHGGTGRLIVFLVPDPPRGRPFGGGGVHHNFRVEIIIPTSYLNNPVFMGNHRCIKGGQYLSSQTAPELYESAVITFSWVIVFGGGGPVQHGVKPQ